MAARQAAQRPRRVPQRTCITCRRTEAKRGLVRLVRTADGAVVIDGTGKQAGRGAYLCAERPCWDGALKRNLVERALRVELGLAARAALAAYAEQLPSAELAAEGAMD
jgi:uncharacterized protein